MPMSLERGSVGVLQHHPEQQEVGPGLYPRYENAMIEYLTFFVQNLRSEFDFSDLANPSKLPQCIGDPISNWSLGYDQIVENVWKDAFPRRSTFAFNLVLMSLTLGELEDSPGYCSEAVLLGTGKIENRGSCFGTWIAEMVFDLLPLEDQNFVDFIPRCLVPKKGIAKFSRSSSSAQGSAVVSPV